MSKAIKGIVIFFCGLIFGGVLYSALCSHAVDSYTDLVRINYQIGQQVMATKAKERNDIEETIKHYKNIIDTYGVVKKNLDSCKKTWTFSYPIFSTINKAFGIAQIENSKASEGIYHALLSDAFERSGRITEARMELQTAASLLGCGDDLSKIKNIVEMSLKSEKKLLESPLSFSN